MSMKDKLSPFLKRVKNGEYTTKQLDDVDALSASIATDINSTSEEVIAMLGFLLENNYVKIEPNKGITLKEDDPEIANIIRVLTS